jgi:hypothetical protein
MEKSTPEGKLAGPNASRLSPGACAAVLATPNSSSRALLLTGLSRRIIMVVPHLCWGRILVRSAVIRSTALRLNGAGCSLASPHSPMVLVR